MRALALILIASSTALAAPVSLDREYTVAQLQSVAQQLQSVQERLQAAPGGRAQWGQTLDELQAARTALDEVMRQVRVAAAAGGGVVVKPQPQSSTVLSPMGDATLRALVNQINAAPPDDKVRVLQEAAQSNWFLVDQAARVLNAFGRPADRLNALAALAERILDRANNFKLLSAFAAPGDRERAQQILQAAPPLRAQ